MQSFSFSVSGDAPWF